MNVVRWLAVLGLVGATGTAVALRGPVTGVGTAPTTMAHQSFDDLNAPYDGRYHFVRVRYESGGGRGGFGFGGRGGGPPWAHDYPRAELNFLQIVGETTFIDPLLDGSNILTFDDPRLFQYPIAYIVEVGRWDPADSEVAALAQYLQKGGFLIVDDFGGNRELSNLEFQLNRALPGAQLFEIGEDHEIFDSFFRINPRAVVPPYSRGRGAPMFFGVYEDNDRDKRLLAIINFNNDIAEYWEFSDRGYYPIDLANEAYKLGVNYLVYAMTH